MCAYVKIKTKETEKRPKVGKESLYLNLYTVQEGNKIKKEDLLQNLEIQFLMDTGADCTLINYDTYKAIKQQQPNLKIKDSDTIIKAANGEPMKIQGVIKILLQEKDNGEAIMTKIRVYSKQAGKMTNILGKDFINKISNSWL